MSTRDALLVPDPARLPEPLREPIEGVSFADYLFVEAARLDDLPLPRVLAWLGVSESAFDRAEERWDDRLGDALLDETGFDALYDDLLGRALLVWARRVDPLDSDVGAWLTLQRHALDAEDPSELARSQGLTPGDELRLSRLWREQLTDPAVAMEAEAAWSGPLRALPSVVVAPLAFPQEESL